MIFYFSVTGNSKYVAQSLAQEGEKLVFIPDAIDHDEYDYEVSDERVGVVSPTYDWTMSSIVSEFLEKLNLHFAKKPYLYYVATYGTTSGASASMANRLLKKKGLAFDALFDVKMPDTWTPIFDLSNPEKVKKTLAKSEGEIKELKGQIQAKLKGRHLGIIVSTFAGKMGRSLYNRSVRKTEHFTVTDACIGCGLCARKCPAHAIEMKERHPVWVKEKCVMCLGCLHRCPKFAIQHGKQTAKHGQYVNPYAKA